MLTSALEATTPAFYRIKVFSKIQLVIYYQYCVVIG